MSFVLFDVSPSLTHADTCSDLFKVNLNEQITESPGDPNEELMQ